MIAPSLELAWMLPSKGLQEINP